MATIARSLIRGRWGIVPYVRLGSSGQDLLEYALLAGFIALFIGAMIPAQIVPAICHIYTKLNSVLYNFNGN